jgi:hypothetical protein
MQNYPEIANKLLRYQIHDTIDPVIAPRISNKIVEIMDFLEKNNSLMDRYIVEYVSELSELGYMMKQITSSPIDLNIDTSNYSYDLSISGYTEKGTYPYSDKNKEPNNIVSVRQTEFDIIYIFDKTDFIGAKINGNTVNK